jgi:hypothetical protein
MPTYRNDGQSSVYIESLEGKVSVFPGRSVQTYKILGSPFIKVAEAPYFPLVSVYESAFASPGTKTGLLSCKVIRLTASGDITVKANHADNPYPLALIDGTALDIENHGEIESLVFTGTGTVKIEGF